jgi:hypothetical protein
MTKTVADDVKVIVVARHFSRFPAGRFFDDGPFSGQAFREKFLVPALAAGQRFIVDLDGTAGFGSSFLEEAFGGLVRSGIPANQVMALMDLKSSDESVIAEINDYIQNAQANG